MIDVHFGEYVLDRSRRQLRHRTGAVRIGSRALDLLELLAVNCGRVVGRDEIMEVVWPGTAVGDNNLNVQLANLRKLLGAEAIVTVPGRGLLFALEVTAGGPGLALPDQPSVVVLPFDTLTGPPELDWLADGIVEDVTTELSRFRDLFVVARNSAYAYGHAPRDLRVVARELGVRYVVEGSVRARPDRVRVAAQLIDAARGGHVWAETFERPLTDHFDAQAQLARTVATSLSPQIDRAEAARIRVAASADLTAHGLARRGWDVISSGEMAYDPGPREEAAALARSALDLDPVAGLAWRTLAWAAWWNVYHGTTESVPDTLAEGIAAATRAIDIDKLDHHARRLRGQLNLMAQNVAAGLPELLRAHELNPNCAVTLCWLGFYEAIEGDPARGVPRVEAGLRRSPRDPARGSMLCALGFAQFAARDYAATSDAAVLALMESAQAATPLILGTIGQVGEGRLDAAAESFRRVQVLAPKLTEARLSGRWLSANPDYRTRAHTFFRVAAGQLPPDAAETLR